MIALLSSTKIQSCYFDIILKVSKVIAKLIYPYEAIKNIVCLQPLFFKLYMHIISETHQNKNVKEHPYTLDPDLIVNICPIFIICPYVYVYMGFRGGSVVKHPPTNAGDAGLIPGLETSAGEGNGNPL